MANVNEISWCEFEKGGFYLCGQSVLGPIFLVVAREINERHDDLPTKTLVRIREISERLREINQDPLIDSREEELLQKDLHRIESLSSGWCNVVVEDFNSEEWDNESFGGIIEIFFHDKTHNERLRMRVKLSDMRLEEILVTEYVESEKQSS